MLFQQLYNWIKYKTLPSSFLFKNRLFIERDSKNKRIFNNFNLIFRNSKWTNYEMNNLNFIFKIKYVKYFFIIILVILYFQNSYMNFYFFNNISFIFWTGIDIFDYYFSFFLWLIISFFSTILNLIYSYFFFNNFSNKKKFIKQNSTIFNLKKKQIYSKLNNNLLIKHDYKWIIYSWLNTNSNVNDIKLKNKILINLFDANFNKTNWFLNHEILLKLYKSCYFLNLNNYNNSKYNINTKISYLLNYNDKRIVDFNIFFSINKFALNSIFLPNKNNLNSLHSNSLFFLKTKEVWNLNNFSQNLLNNEFLSLNKNNLFYLTNLNFNSLNKLFFSKEFNFLFENIKNQNLNSKWNRWLYKYSILHRKIFKNTHKITLSKQLLNLNFYNFDFINKSIWFIKNYDEKKFYNFNFKKTHFDLLNNNDNNRFFNSNLFFNNNNNNNLINLNLLKTNEVSFFWFIKRFFFFNALNENKIVSNLKLKKKLNKNEKKNLNYSIFFSFLLKNINTSNKEFSFFQFYRNNTLNIKNVKTTTFNLKDIFLFLNDKNLFNDNLIYLYYITSSTFNLNKNLQLNYYSYSLNLNDNNLFMFFNNEDFLNKELSLNHFFRNNDYNCFYNDLNFFYNFI